MPASKRLNVYMIDAWEDTDGSYAGYFIISQDDANVLEFSNMMHQDQLERYDEFIASSLSDGKTYVAKDLLLVEDTRPTKIDKETQRPLGFPDSYQRFGFTCKSFY